MKSETEARVQRIFEQELADPRIVSSVNDLPASFDLISPAWLTEAICGPKSRVRVESFALDARDDGSSNRCRIKLEYNIEAPASQFPSSVFCKGSLDLKNRLGMGLSGAAIGEVNFYNSIRRQIEIEAPQAYFASFDAQSFKSIIILDDKTGLVQFGRDDTAIDRPKAESMVTSLAKLHAGMHRSELLTAGASGLRSWPEQIDALVSAVQLDEYSIKGFLAAEEEIPSGLFSRWKQVWSATYASVQKHKHLSATLMHCDTHLKNWYAAPGDVMGLFDWQLTCIGHGTRDLSYTISVALDPADRRLWERDLIRLYAEEYMRNGGEQISADEVWDLYRSQMMTALAWWTFTLTPPPQLPANMQPEDTTRKFIRRIAAAIDDLDSLNAALQ